MSGSEDKRVPVNQISQFMRSTTHITGLGNQVPTEFTLQAEVILINVRSAQMRIDEVNSASAERQKPLRAEIDILRRWTGWKRIWLAGIPERIAEDVGTSRIHE